MNETTRLYTRDGIKTIDYEVHVKLHKHCEELERCLFQMQEAAKDLQSRLDETEKMNQTQRTYFDENIALKKRLSLAEMVVQKYAHMAVYDDGLLACGYLDNYEITEVEDAR